MKIVVFVKNKEIISAFEHEGNIEIENNISSAYIDTAENLMLIMNAIGIEDTSKIEFFKSNSNEEI